MDELYEVSFSGQIQADADLDEVKARIAKMFKADEVTVARLFSGKRIVIRKNLSAEAAEKYSIAFTKAGAICDLDLMPETVASTPAVDRAAAKASSSAADGSAGGKRRLKKIAALSAIAVVVVAALVAATFYVTGILAG